MSDVIEPLGTSSKYEAAETEKGSSREVEEATHAIVEKRMRTDIVMEEMGQSLESQSPERKRLLTPEEELARQQELAASAVVVSESQAADEEDPEAYEAKEFCTEEYSEAECAEEEEAERKMLAEDDEERQKIQEDEVRSETQPNILDEIETKSFVSDTQNDILDVTEEHAPESEVLDYQEPSIREPDEEQGHREHRVSETEHKYISEHLDRIDDVDDVLEAEAAASPMDDDELRGVHQQVLRSPQQEHYTDEPSSSADESPKSRDVDVPDVTQSGQRMELELLAPSAPDLEYVSPSEPTHSLPQSYRLQSEASDSRFQPDSGFHGDEQGATEAASDDHAVMLSPECREAAEDTEAAPSSGTFESYAYKPSTEPEHLEHEEEHYEPGPMTQEVTHLKDDDESNSQRILVEEEKKLLKEGMELIGEEINLLEETEKRLEEEKEHIEEEMEHIYEERRHVEEEKRHLKEVKEQMDEDKQHVDQEKLLMTEQKELIKEGMEMMEEEIGYMEEQKELLQKEREYLFHEEEHVHEEKEHIERQRETLTHMKDEIEHEKLHIEEEKMHIEEEKEHLREAKEHLEEERSHLMHELEEHDPHRGSVEVDPAAARKSLDMTVRVRPLDALSPETPAAAATLPSPIHVSTETFAQPVWEAALDHAEQEDTEMVHDIPIERQTVLEREEEGSSSSVGDSSVREHTDEAEGFEEQTRTQANGGAAGVPQSMSFEDAQRLAVEIVSDIKSRLSEHPELVTGEESVTGTMTAVEPARQDSDARLQDSMSSDKVTTDSSELSRLSDEQPPVLMGDERRQLEAEAAAECKQPDDDNVEGTDDLESLPRPAPDSVFTSETHSKVDEYLRQLTEEGSHDDEHCTMVQQVVERKAADLSRRRHVNLESLEITDEDLRESGNDLSPLESHMERLRQMSVVALDQTELEELRGESDLPSSGHEVTELTEKTSTDGSTTERRQRVISSGDFEEGVSGERTIFTTTVVRSEEDDDIHGSVTGEAAHQAEVETQTQRQSRQESLEPDVFEASEKGAGSVSFADEQSSKLATEFYRTTSTSRESESTFTKSFDEQQELLSRSSEEASELISKSADDTFEKGTAETAEKLRTSITRSSEESFSKSTEERSENLTRSSGEASEAITRSTEETFEAAVKATDEATEKLIRTAGLLSRSAETRLLDEQSETTTRSSCETSEAVSRSTELFDMSLKMSDGKSEKHLKTSADVSETFGRSLEEVSEEISRSTEETSARSTDEKSERIHRTSADVSEAFAKSQQETSEALTKSVEESCDSSSEDKSEKVRRVATEVSEAFSKSLVEGSEKTSTTSEEMVEVVSGILEGRSETLNRTSTESSEVLARSSSETSESRSLEETSESWLSSADAAAGLTAASRLTERTLSRSSDSRAESSLVSSRESVVTVVDRRQSSESPSHQRPSSPEKLSHTGPSQEMPEDKDLASEPVPSPERGDETPAVPSCRQKSSDEEQWPLRSTSFESGVVMRQRSASSRPDSELRRSAADSPSSGDSRYQTAAEGLSDSSRATSRPTSSEVELLGGTHTGTPSEYETALSATTGSSQDYYTAKTSLSWPGRSLDSSESSGHLASVEVSEPSETLMTSAVELDRESTPTGHPAEEEEPKAAGHDEDDGDDAKAEGADQSQEESGESTPEEQEEARAEAEQFEGDDLFVEPNMKRSAEMVFGPPGQGADVIQGHVFGEKERDNDRVVSPEPAMESVSEPVEPTKIMQESIDSASETSRLTGAEQPSATESQRAAIKETWRTESERMDLSSASEQLSTMTCSLMSESCLSETLCQDEPSGPPPLPLPRDRILEQDDTGSQLSETDTEEVAETLQPSPPPLAVAPPAERVLRRALSESATSSAVGERLRAQLLEKGLSEERAEWEIQQIMTQPSDPSIAPSLERPDSPEPMADYPTRMPSETPVTPEFSPECRPSPQPAAAPTISVTEAPESAAQEEAEASPQQVSPPSDKSPTSSEKSSSDEGREYVLDEQPEFAPAIPTRVHETIPEEEEDSGDSNGRKGDSVASSVGAAAPPAPTDLSPDEFILVEGGGRLDSIVSPPPTVTPLSRVRYFPEEVQKITEDTVSPTDEDIDVSEQKRWAEQQFESARGATGTDYQAEELFTKHLEDIIEEEREEVLSNRELERLKESLSSTPELEMVARGRLVSRSGESDDVSLSSLQEFERLELLMAQRGSQDSLGSSTNNNSGSGSGSGNGNGVARRNGSPRAGSSQGDDVSVNSLQEFEGLERQCQLAQQIEARAEQAERLLSEIEEGHESQMSESDSCETVSRASERAAERDDQLFEIDEIIRQAQSNVERLHAEDELMSDSLRLEDIVDMTESSLVVDTPPGEREDDSPASQQRAGEPVDSPLRRRLLSEAAGAGASGSADSLERAPRPGAISADSIEAARVMTDSIEEPRQMTDSIEEQRQMTDSIEEQRRMTDSIEEQRRMTDSVEGRPENRPAAEAEPDAPPQQMTDSLELSSAAGGPWSDPAGAAAALPGDVPSGSAAARDALLCSFDSVSSSQATNATYQCESDSLMSSSMASTMSATIMGSNETLGPEADLDGAAAGPSVSSRTFQTPGRVSEGEWSTDEPGFDRVRYRSVQMPGEGRQTTFSGPGAAAAAQAFALEMQPGEDLVESQVTDEHGNVHVQRVLRRRVVVEAGAQPVPAEQLEALLAGADPGPMEETEEVEDDGHGHVRRVLVRRQCVTVTRTGGQTTAGGPTTQQTTVTFSCPPAPSPPPSAPRRAAHMDTEDSSRGTAEPRQGTERGDPAESPAMFSELVEGTSGQGPTLRRMVRTETRTQTTFDDEGRPVTRTVTERITTDADGTESREIVETED
ncbi:nucleoprotein TPR-like [Amphibalanus amphitrite]|uniref:nucleoprotein TPR-like n=1 Tax=Amphibalanus amphitrite TaxID=1232801 RepID=UPI001C92AA68|nr:nucleoprotein TPR-like [Amphibalanus amphitrite]